MNINNNSNLLFNNSSHPIIQENNTYSLDTRLLTIHNIDRDLNYSKNSSIFSVVTPDSYLNVDSIRLIEISFPNKILNFSNNLNNNSFLLKPDNSSDISNCNISNGCYSYTDLSDYLNNLSELSNNNIKVFYSDIKQRYIFYRYSDNNNNSFSLIYQSNNNCINKQPITNTFRNPSKKSNNTINTFNNNKNYDININEGFLYDLGFDLSHTLSNQTSSITSQTIENINNISHLLNNGKCEYITTTSPPRFRNFQPIYLEINSFINNYDELNPFPSGQNNFINNFSNTSTRSAFFKIPYYIYEKGGIYINNNNNIVSFFDPPIKRIQNLNIKFRYHDNTLVDFDNQDLNFTLEIKQLKNSFTNNFSVQKSI